MALRLMDHILCRTPVFSRDAAFNENWPVFKQLIREASPSLYEIIADSEYDDVICTTGKVWFSLWKYFNRTKFRPAPFGGFAAITLLDQFDGDLPLMLDSKLTLNELIDWQEKDAIVFPSSPAAFQANSSIYIVGGEIRYIRFKDDRFEINSVEFFPELEAVIDCCRATANRADIAGMLARRFKKSNGEANRLILQMVNLQLLFSETHPNITGADYFERMGARATVGYRKYLIAERRRISGRLDQARLKHLPNLVNFLANELPHDKNPILTGFLHAFIKKFDQNTVPLALALDPETGIDYGGFAGDIENDAEATFAFGNEEEIQQEPWPFTALHKFLLKSVAYGQTIRLEEFSGPVKEQKLPLPNSLNIVLHFNGCNAVVENAGGCTANMLPGRFTMGSKAVEDACLKVALLEQEANPHVLFFDIAYQAEKSVDNVNRRKHLYAAELPILSWSTHPASIHFDDIFVMVRNNEVVLWSKKLNKRLVPRIPSAYNYTRSDLAVYRFLCDLQYQNILSDLNFNLARFFPEMAHYPRVVYKDIIVSPARWLVPAALTGRDKPANKNELAIWLHKEGIDFLFRAGHTDQTLIFDPKSAADMDAFLLFLRQYSKQAVYISEALIEPDNLVQDENGHPYISQFIVPYCHSEAIYRSYNFHSSDHYCKPFANFRFPGSDWLYFEIYCHPVRSDQLLSGKILAFIKASKTKVIKWFFIRYADPKPHIRLRLQLKNPELAQALTTELNILLSPECTTGLISDIQIKTYVRETERYGIGRMNLAEHFFFLDSKMVLASLSRAKTPIQRYSAVLAIMDRLIAIFLPDISKRIEFIGAIASNFTSEFAISQENFKVLNRNFKSLELAKKDEETLNPKYSRYEKVFLKLISQCNGNAEQNKMAADLIHMHINRSFHSAQRLHEATLFHYLLKKLTMRRALSAC